MAFLHSPLLKLSSGVRSNNLMHGVDWLPTFMAAIGRALYSLYDEAECLLDANIAISFVSFLLILTAMLEHVSSCSKVRKVPEI